MSVGEGICEDRANIRCFLSFVSDLPYHRLSEETLNWPNPIAEVTNMLLSTFRPVLSLLLLWVVGGIGAVTGGSEGVDEPRSLSKRQQNIVS